MTTEPGIFTVSLDFELYWGVRDKRSIDQYRPNLLGTRQATLNILKVFERYAIHGSWATVGFLFFDNRQQLLAGLPTTLPGYHNTELSPYHYIDRQPELTTDYHFAPELIEKIRRTPGQEIATHTFSHYYCLEAGQTPDDFRNDLKAALAIAAERGISVDSLVFPRNQWNPAYLPILAELGIRAYRGNESSWLYRASDESGQHPLRRALRLLDAYINLSGHHSYRLQDCVSEPPFNLPASRFLRPYSRRLSALEGLRLRRIKKAMTDAARRGWVFHLWWHPHNFGTHTEQNIALLTRIAEHYAELRQRYGMRSCNMAELADRAAQCLDRPVSQHPTMTVPGSVPRSSTVSG